MLCLCVAQLKFWFQTDLGRKNSASYYGRKDRCFRLFTSAKGEVKDSRRSGMYQSWHFWDKIGHAKSLGVCFYSAVWRSESRISSRYLEITSISLIIIVEGRIIVLAFPEFEPTHRCDPSDQRRLWVEGLADCASATQCSWGCEK